ncbi:MAG: hypothetical protein WBX25_20425 [Rhodomicrobium sp.]
MLHDLRETYRREDDNSPDDAAFWLKFVMIALVTLALFAVLIFASLKFGPEANVDDLFVYL